MSPEAEAKLRAALDRYSHLDMLLGDPVWCESGEAQISWPIAGDLYRAIRDALEGETE